MNEDYIIGMLYILFFLFLIIENIYGMTFSILMLLIALFRFFVNNIEF
jgi:hypothetical protein